MDCKDGLSLNGIIEIESGERIHVGENVQLRRGVSLCAMKNRRHCYDTEIRIGDNVFLNERTKVWATDRITIGNNVMVGPDAPAVLDELVVQSPVMASLNPSSVNTVRLYSLVIGEECTFFASFLRMGRNGAIVDNLGSGGLLAGIDLNTGTVFTPGADDTGRCFDTHPDTGVSIRSFQIPRWQELLRFTEEAAMHYPMKYVGWDIAVCENGFQIIEANPDPMIHGIQTKFNGGRKKQYEEFKKRITEYRNGIH